MTTAPAETLDTLRAEKDRYREALEAICKRAWRNFQDDAATLQDVQAIAEQALGIDAPTVR